MGSRELGGKHFRRGQLTPPNLHLTLEPAPCWHYQPEHSTTVRLNRAGGQGKPSLSAHFAFLFNAQFLSTSAPTNYNSTPPPPPPLWAGTLQVAGGGRIVCGSAAQWEWEQPGTSATSAAPDCPVLGSRGPKKYQKSQRKKSNIIFLAGNNNTLLDIFAAGIFWGWGYFGAPRWEHFRWGR